MTKRVSFILSVIMTACAFFALILCPRAAAGGARDGLSLCGGVIVPSLFPFMVIGNLISELGLAQRLGRLFAPIMKKLFGVSGSACTPLFLGLTGGYPLGAAAVSELYSRGEIGKSEAERLLGFCNNTGPAFIVGVAGGAVFRSAAVGFYLYGIHILSAVLTGILLRSKPCKEAAVPKPAAAKSFPSAFTASIKRAASTCVTVCGFVVFFSVVVGLLDASGAMPALTGKLSASLHCELHFIRSLLTGFLELGTGISSMRGLSVNAGSLALCSFVLAWGGLSVHAQALAVIGEGGLSSVWHFPGKLLHGILSALITVLAFPLFF